MRIGIDARLYGPKNRGLGRYIQKLIENLERIDKKNEYLIFLRKDNFKEYQPKNQNFKKILADFRWYTLKEQILMPCLVRKSRIDLMHFPHFNVPIFCPVKFVVTIHDLIINHFPTSRASTLNPVLYKLKLLGYKFIIKQAVKRAEKIITVSKFTKRDLLKQYNLKEEKIEIVYEGVGAKILGSRSNILEKLEIEDHYLLYVGAAYPHKNLEKLIEAFSILQERNKHLQLVLVGRKDFFYQRLEKEVLKRYSYSQSALGATSIGNKIIFAGYLSDKELGELYQRALIYVFPSLMEGFGLPPLEAMSYGVPVAAAQASCLPEVLDKAAVFFNPNDVNNMVKIIDNLIKDKKLREELINKGKELIKKYSWQICARKTLNIYNNSL